MKSICATFKDNWFILKKLLKRVMKWEIMVEFLDKLVLEGRNTDMPGPGLDTGAYILSHFTLSATRLVSHHHPILLVGKQTFRKRW